MAADTENVSPQSGPRVSPPQLTLLKNPLRPWVYDLLLVYILIVGAYFRLVGLYWGEYQYLHPDERFLVWVGTDISPVQDLNEYFDTARSSLNPHNRGHGFYVYGTLPMFITRYVVEWIFGHSGFMEMTQVGRALSASADLLVVLLVFLVAERLYDRRVGLLAAAFSAVAVLQIQQSHFFTMDTFINLFSLLAFYFAIRISTSFEGRNLLKGFFLSPILGWSLAFGAALGMAVASKLNAAPMALALPAAMLVWLESLPEEERNRRIPHAIAYLAIAGLVSLVVFRVAQPYAFQGPGFFGVKPNELWLNNLRDLRAQSNGNVDFPPALQWARRSVLFSGKNLILWGLGVPLGLLSWAGFLWAGWRLFKGEWRQHGILWGWTAFYFTWQSLALNPTMRYQLPIYPMLAIFAGWGIVRLFDKEKTADSGTHQETRKVFCRLVSESRLAIGIGAITLVLTAAYAFAFTRIYTRPITRVEASRWIYQNIAGPVTLLIETGEGEYRQPVPVPYEFVITPGTPYLTEITINASGKLHSIRLPNVQNFQPAAAGKKILLTFLAQPGQGNALGSATIFPDTPAIDDGDYLVQLDHALTVEDGQRLALQIELFNPMLPTSLPGHISLGYQIDENTLSSAPLEQPVDQPLQAVDGGAAYQTMFRAEHDGFIRSLIITSPTGIDTTSLPETLKVSIETPGEELEAMVADLALVAPSDPTRVVMLLSQPILVIKGTQFKLILGMQPGQQGVKLLGEGLANEGEWDDGLPLRLDGYDGFGGIYPLDLNFNMYWDDNPDKLARFQRILDASDYIVITSNRQWGSLPRLPERFPLTTLYYRSLMGCPNHQSIYYCYAVARPGMYQGELGFELVKVFQSDPSLGALRINDQFAEEAFHVYDHPKVLIFKKSADYDPARVASILGTVDFSLVVHVLPMQVGPQPANLLLPIERKAEQVLGGTWRALFDPKAPQNHSQLFGVILWYVSISALGWITYPLLRLALPGLPDRGYPLARKAGLLILSYMVWMAGSFRIPFTRQTISLMIVLMAIVGAFLAFQQRKSLLADWRKNRNYYLAVEFLTLAFFLLDLGIRLGNPDLWHPWKGGEKPMDFAYFNAVLKSTSFPPYDPWFAGGYLNYYYYGFVFMGTPVKWLGIVPAFAYNLIIPTLFSLIAMGAFSIVWNLYSARRRQDNDPAEGVSDRKRSYGIALAGALGMAVLGNLGIVRMIYQGYQRIAAPGGVTEGANSITRFSWALSGFVKALTGTPLPYSVGDWYWIPSRAIPAPADVEPITEFPFFTVLYADLHAHLFSLPITLLALAFALSIILARRKRGGLIGAAAALLLGALAIGALRPTNTWDFYPYLALGSIALVYSIWRHGSAWEDRLQSYISSLPRSKLGARVAITLGAATLLILLAFGLYTPYAQWYVQGYTQIGLWTGTHTPLSSYLVHWGLFLFVLVSWMAWESVDWMAKTPLSSLRKLEPYKNLLTLSLLSLIAVIIALLWLKAAIAWFVLPLAAWAGILILRPDQPDEKRFVLFLTGTGLFLTLMVEVIVLKGDIGRMNTVFKFYLQVWTLFAVSSAAALGWLSPAIQQWTPHGRNGWQAILVVLVFGAALYPLLAGTAKIKDRMVPEAPHTLDGMSFMHYATYTDEWGEMDLSQDRRAIQWLLENVEGSPVIVEANLRNLYRWGSRMSIYTGLPGVVGWEWHQQQQRAALPGTIVSNRIAEVAEFYTSIDIESTLAFLRKYQVKYIILGQQERGMYPGQGLDKFSAFAGIYWQEVYREKDTVIYQVNEK